MVRSLALLGLLLPCAFPLSGQGTGSAPGAPRVEDAMGRLAPDSAMDRTLLRRGGTHLVRWVTSPTGWSLPAALGSGVSASVLAPELRVVHNSALSYSPNEGSLWASRGPSTRILLGGILESGHLELTLAPELTWTENRAYQVYRSTDPDRHPYASPWHVPPHASADLPLRPGAESLWWIHPGQSSLAVRWRSVRGGVSTENRWWGPGLGNALVLGADGPGFPHVFLETSAVGTPLGEIEAAWILGRLTASPWFTASGEAEARTVSGLAFALSVVDGFRIGAARLLVRAGAPGPLDAADPILSWESVWREDATGTVVEPSTDQISSIFFQLTPADRVELYGEWARVDLPHDLRELLETPQHSQGYTIGFQWRSPGGSSGRSVRVQAEATNLEQTRVRGDRPAAPSFYTGRATPEGLTHRGRVLGAAIGPGAQSQHLSLDLLSGGPEAAPNWRTGLMLGRARWENDTFSRLPLATQFSHDTSLLFGVRAAGRASGIEAEGQVVYQKRFNYLFQNGINRPGGLRTVDVTNWTVGLTLRPTGRRP